MTRKKKTLEALAKELMVAVSMLATVDKRTAEANAKMAAYFKTK